MIYSNERGSVVDAQVTLFEEQKKELDRCFNPHYFYLNYLTVQKEDGSFIKPVQWKSTLGVSIKRSSKINIGNKNGKRTNT